MKLVAGTALITCLLFAGDQPKSPEVFFEQGATLMYEGQTSFPGRRAARYTCTLKIEKSERNGKHCSSTGTIAYTFRSRALGYSILCRFAADSLNFYVHTTNFAQRSTTELEQSVADDAGDSLIYPLNMKVGDTLPGAWYTSTKSQSGVFISTDDVRYTKRRVESLDTLKLGVGPVPAYRITMTEVASKRSSSPHTGNETNTASRQMTEWFSPVYGIVKMQNGRSGGVDMIELVSCRWK
jgi:hypothetical protein